MLPPRNELLWTLILLGLSASSSNWRVLNRSNLLSNQHGQIRPVPKNQLLDLYKLNHNSHCDALPASFPRWFCNLYEAKFNGALNKTHGTKIWIIDSRLQNHWQCVLILLVSRIHPQNHRLLGCGVYKNTPLVTAALILLAQHFHHNLSRLH